MSVQAQLLHDNYVDKLYGACDISGYDIIEYCKTQFQSCSWSYDFYYIGTNIAFIIIQVTTQGLFAN